MKEAGVNFERITNLEAEPTQDEPIFLDVPTAAASAGFSLRHFRRFIKNGDIPIVEFNKGKNKVQKVLVKELKKFVALTREAKM